MLWQELQTGFCRCSLHPLPQRRDLVRFCRFIDLDFNARWRVWRFRAQNVFENELAALNGRCAVGHRGHDKDTALSDDAPARIVFCQRDAAEQAAFHIRNSIMPGQTLVQECVIGVEQIDNAAIFTNDAFEEHLHFALQGETQISVEVRRFRVRTVQLAQSHPFGCEIVDERFGFRIFQHAARLLFEHAGIRKFAGNSEIQKLVVRNAAPKEKRKPGSEFDVAQTIWRPGRNIRGHVFHAQNESRIDKYARNRAADAAFEGAFAAAFLIETKQSFHGSIVIFYRLFEGAGCERAKNLFCARQFIGRLVRRTNKYAAPARCMAGSAGVERAP